jgi:H+/Cl- antiporter ClcA/CBS domain-containing protein
MLISAIAGLLAGINTAFLLWLLRLVVGGSALNSWLGSRWFTVPLIIGATVAFFSRTKSKKNSDKSDSIPDLFEEFHYGIQRATPMVWTLRAVVSAALALLTGIFGLEGAVIESVTAMIQWINKKLPRSVTRIFLHDIEMRQVVVDATISGSFSIALGAPFTAALLSLELLSVSGARVRIAAFTSALMSYGVWRLLTDALSVEPIGVIRTLFMGFRTFDIETFKLIKIAAAAFFVGALVVLVFVIISQLIIYVKKILNKERAISPVRAVMAGSGLLAITVFFTPEAFVEPWRIWQDLAWTHFSGFDALTLFAAKAIALIFALSVFGSWGILTPALSLAALIGYSTGFMISPNWALPLALAACAAAVYGAVGAPLAALALIWETCGDGNLWTLAVSAVAGGYLVKYLFARFDISTHTITSALLELRGMRLLHGRCTDVLKDVTMADAMSTDFSTIEVDATIQQMQSKAATSHYNVIAVCGANEEFVGLLALDKLPSQAELKGISPQDLIDIDTVVVDPDAPLEQAFALLDVAPALAVVDKKRKLQGLVFRGPVITRYHREIGRKALAHYTRGG